MPFTDKQFEEFLKAMDTREMLVRIDENTKNFHQHLNKRLDDHIAQDYTDHGTVGKSVTKAHERIDEAREELDEKLSKSLAFQNKLLGAILLLVFLVPILANWWFKKGQ